MQEDATHNNEAKEMAAYYDALLSKSFGRDEVARMFDAVHGLTPA